MKTKNFALLSFFLMALSGCQVVDDLQSDFNDARFGNTVPTTMVSRQSEDLLKSHCPQVKIVDDLSSLSDFTSPKNTVHSELISRIDITRAESNCTVASKSAVVELKVIFEGLIGPKGRANPNEKPFFSYPFFIAVTAPNGEIMAKEVFAASMSYAPGETTHDYFEQMRQVIPIKNKKSAHRYKVLIGFQITPDQLEYNRKMMVPKQDTTTKNNNPIELPR